MDWILSENKSLVSVGNLNTSIGVISDDDLVIRAGKVRILKFFDLNTESRDGIQLKTNNDECVTVMKCNRGLEGFCDPYSSDPITGLGQIVLGQYLKLLPCFPYPAISQTFNQYNHNCTMEKLQKCSDECSLEVFDGNKNNCSDDEWTTLEPTYPTPTSTPSSHPTIASTYPESVPTPPPTLLETYFTPGPSRQPTLSPITEDPELGLSRTPEPTIQPLPEEKEEKPSGWDYKGLFALIPLGILALVGLIVVLRRLSKQ